MGCGSVPRAERHADSDRHIVAKLSGRPEAVFVCNEDDGASKLETCDLCVFFDIERGDDFFDERFAHDGAVRLEVIVSHRDASDTCGADFDERAFPSGVIMDK